MAEHLASIFGTEKDRVNCPFYFKIGACRHGDRCSRLHNRPTISPTVLLHNLYMNPVLNAPLGADGLPLPVDAKKVQEFFQDFYEDIFEELAQYGEIEYLNVCDNLADHMVGNVYVKFKDEEAAARALQGLQGRYYAGKPIQVEFSPVTDFREATCRQYEEGTCTRGGYCNFMHVRPVSRELRKQLFGRWKDGTGGSTRFHDGDGPRGGNRGRFDNRGGGQRYGNDRYNDRRGGGGSRYDRDGGSRDYDRGRRYDRDDRRGGGGGGGRRESSAERRARIAQWNSEAGATVAAAAPTTAYAPPAPTGYGGPPPLMTGGYPNGAGAAAPPAAGGGYGGAQYGAPPPQQQMYGGGGGGGYQPPAQQYGGGGGRGRGQRGDFGGSGSNTIPIGQPKYPPPQ